MLTRGAAAGSQALEVVPGELYVATVRRIDSWRVSPVAQRNLCYSPDDELVSAARAIPAGAPGAGH